MFTIIHTESSTGWGGQENRTLKESLGLKRLGARVIITSSPESVLIRKAAQMGLEVRSVSLKRGWSPKAILSLLRIIKREDVDIISTHSGKDSLAGGIAGRISGKMPVIVRTRHLALPITSKLTYSILPHKVVTVSEYVRNLLIKERVPEENVISIPTGVDLEVFNPGTVTPIPKEELGIPKRAEVIGTVAVMRKKKGHHILLNVIPEVLKMFPEAFFLFIGDGPQRQNIEKRIEELGIGEKIRITGMRDDLPRLLKTVDLFVLPTLQEALGTSFLEAMAMEKPVIGTMVGGIAEVVKDGVTGVLVEPEDSNAIAEAIIGLLKDRDRMRRMGAEGRRVVEEEYGVELMSKRLFDLYLSLVERY